MRRAYEDYLACVRASLDAPYPYDIVGHIGYVSRNAPYENKKLRYDDYVAQLNDILETVIATLLRTRRAGALVRLGRARYRAHRRAVRRNGFRAPRDRIYALHRARTRQTA